MKIEPLSRTFLKISLAVAAVTLLLANDASAQGTVNFNNKVSIDGINAPIYDFTVGGAMLEGTNYLAQLYSGPVGTTEDKLVPTGAIVDFRTNVAAGYLNVGANGSRTIPNVALGDSAVLQVRAWTAATGATYEDALASNDPNSRVGKSDLIVVTTKTSALSTPTSMTGLQSFAIGPVGVPEPSVQLLGAVGLTMLAIRRFPRKNLTSCEQTSKAAPLSADSSEKR